jgi:hypothetical protein
MIYTKLARNFFHLRSTVGASYLLQRDIHTLLIQILCGRDTLARHLARYILRCRKHAQKIAAGETAQFVRVPPTRIQLRNLQEIFKAASAPSKHEEEVDRKNQENENEVNIRAQESPRRPRSRSW